MHRASIPRASARISTTPPAPRRAPVPKSRRKRRLVDTSVLIDLESLTTSDLPREIAVSAITMAELAAGPHATDDPFERSGRQDRLKRAEAAFGFGAKASPAYGRIYAAVVAAGRKARAAPPHRGDRLRRRASVVHPKPVRLCRPRRSGGSRGGLTRGLGTQALHPLDTHGSHGPSVR